MTEPINDGGPAFPIGDQSLHPLLVGMSLRAWFAGMALQGIVTIPRKLDEDEDEFQAVAEDCCHFADAMLAELAKERQ